MAETKVEIKNLDSSPFNAGSSDVGSSDVGGSDAGGSDAGGSDAGGSNAGGYGAGTAPIYGLLIKTNLTYKVVEHKDFGKAMGCQLDLLDSGKCKRFMAYANEDSLHNDVGTNDLAAYVLDVLGFNLRTFITGVRGDILIANINKEKKIPQAEVEDLLNLCKEIKNNENDDEDVMEHITKKYKHLRLIRGKGK